MLRLVLGTAGSGKTSFITGEIAKKIQAGERGICMIVPEQYSHEAERELCETCGGALSLGAEVFSFTRLAVRVAQEMGTGGKTYLDAGGRLLCMSLALRRIAPELKVFTRAGRDSRLQLELLRTIEELKAACIGYDELQRAAQVLEGELPAKLNDLSLCLEGYEAVLGNGHADPADRILHLADTIGLSKTAKSGQIYIDGFTDFTGAETRVINALIAAGTPVTVCLTLDSLTSESEHFAPARRAAGALMRYAREHGVECEEVYPDSAVGKDDALSFYIEHLFAYTDKSMKDEAGAIQIYRGGDLQSECENAAARCISLVRETGCRWRDIAIAARGFSDYSAVLTETFGLYGVPVFTARRGSIMQKPIPALIESVFSVILGSWSSEDVLAYMKTGLTGVSRDDCDTLERYVTLWSLRPGAWLKKGAWTQHPLGYGKEETPQSIELLDEINSIRRIISEPLMQLAKDGAAASTAGAQVRVLTDFLIRIKLPNTLEEHVRQLEEAGMSQLADEFSQLWSVLCEALQQFDALLGDTPMEQGEFSELFIKMLSCYDLASIPSSPDAVTAGEIDRMRRRNIKHLIFLGASDDRIPASSGSPGLLSEDERGTLEEAGLAVSGGSDSLDREFSLIYNCISLPSETLTISYGASGSEASRLRPSFLISRAALLLGTPIKSIDTDALRLNAEEPAFLLASRYDGAPGAAALAYEYFYSADEKRARLEAVESRGEIPEAELSRAGVEILYRDNLYISPSRADDFFLCRYYYFLRHGLRLNEKETAGFDPPELGSFVHYVLESCIQEISKTTGFKDAQSATVKELVNKYTDAYIADVLKGFEDKSERFIYLFERLRPSVEGIVTDTVRELSRSDFVPLRFELRFGRNGDLPPIRLSDGESQLYLNGVIDRVDGYWKDGKLYLRVVDYKTGKKKFSYTDLWHGLGMQLLLYLFTLEKSGGSLLGGEIVPAGALYVPARDNVISADMYLDDERLQKERASAVRRSGLLLESGEIIEAMERSSQKEYLPVSYNKDGLITGDSLVSAQQLHELSEHVDKRLLEMSQGVASGKIKAVPGYKSKSDNACKTCPYMSVCRFDETSGKRLYMKSMRAKDFWDKMGGGDNG